MPRLGALLAVALLCWGCAHAAPSERPPAAPGGSGRARADAPCVPIELEVSLTECHLPVLSARSSAAANEAFRIAQELWTAQDWPACAAAFEHVLELAPSAALAAEASYAAVLCANNEFWSAAEAQPPPRRATTRRDARWGAPGERSPTFDALVASLGRGVCLVRDPLERSAMEYRRARLYYDQGQAAEAAVLLRRVALGSIDRGYADVAAALWLDSLRELRRMEPRAGGSCDEELRDAAEGLDARFCRPGSESAEADVCELVASLRGAPEPAAEGDP